MRLGISRVIISSRNLQIGTFPEKGGSFMAISYKKLWKLLIDKDMKKKDLQQLAGIRACLKIAFRQLCVTVCGRFGPNERGVVGYVK